jgi:hypothetical protein
MAGAVVGGVGGEPAACRSAGADRPRPVATAADALLARYATYEATERGLCARTVERNVHVLRGFVGSCLGGEVSTLQTLTGGEVTAFVADRARRGPGSVPHPVTTLRSLPRFLHVAGVTRSGWTRRCRPWRGGSRPGCRRPCRGRASARQVFVCACTPARRDEPQRVDRRGGQGRPPDRSRRGPRARLRHSAATAVANATGYYVGQMDPAAAMPRARAGQPAMWARTRCAPQRHRVR